MEATDESQMKFVRRVAANTAFERPLVYNYDENMLDSLSLYYQMVLFRHKVLKRHLHLPDIPHCDGYGLLNSREVGEERFYLLEITLLELVSMFDKMCEKNVLVQIFIQIKQKINSLSWTI